MLIYAIDDEINMLYLLHEAIAEAAPGAQIVDFRSGTAALSQMRQTGAQPDAVFSDIRMPGLSGLELAVKLKGQSPETKLIFVTGYDYALDAPMQGLSQDGQRTTMSMKLPVCLMGMEVLKFAVHLLMEGQYLHLKPRSLSFLKSIFFGQGMLQGWDILDVVRKAGPFPQVKIIKIGHKLLQ